jgi:hypothetical protein
VATYFTNDFADFSTCSAGNCGDWTERYTTGVGWAVSSGDITTVDAPIGDWSVLSWDDVDGDADRDDIELLALITTSSYTTNGTYPLVVRASGSDESATLYSVVLRTAATTTIRIAYCSDTDTPTNAASVSKTLATSTDYWMRFRITGGSPSTIKLKVWSGAIGDEPTTGGAGDGWDISTTDSSGPTGPGWAGLAEYSAAGGFVVKQLGVGTNGDTAPSSAPATGITTGARNLLLLATG